TTVMRPSPGNSNWPASSGDGATPRLAVNSLSVVPSSGRAWANRSFFGARRLLQALGVGRRGPGVGAIQDRLLLVSAALVGRASGGSAARPAPGIPLQRLALP